MSNLEATQLKIIALENTVEMLQKRLLTLGVTAGELKARIEILEGNNNDTRKSNTREPNQITD